MLQDLLDPYPSALEIIYGSKDPDLSEPKIPEFVAAPNPFDVIKSMIPETSAEFEMDIQGGEMMASLDVQIG